MTKAHGPLVGQDAVPAEVVAATPHTAAPTISTKFLVTDGGASGQDNP